MSKAAEFRSGLTGLVDKFVEIRDLVYQLPNTDEEATSAAYNKGISNGKQIWFNNYQGASAVDGLYAFGGPRWNDTLYLPTKSFENLTRTTNMFAYSGITDTKVLISIKSGQTSNCTATFQNATNLITIKEFRGHASLTMSSQFANCKKLENVTLTGTYGKPISFADCSKLNKKSITSIIAVLANSAANTLTLHPEAVGAAFETSTGAKDGLTSPEWLALAASSNWSIVT